MEEKKVALFIADFDHQIAQIEKIYGILETKKTSWSGKETYAESIESTGYWLHNLYCAHEDLFKIVSAFWENSMDSGGAFHKNLLRRMLLQIEGVRPALLSEESFRHLDELRSFRHVFRHAYSYGLDSERVLYLLKKVLKKKNRILTECIKFRKQNNNNLQPLNFITC